jgi:kynurenine formamidase
MLVELSHPITAGMITYPGLPGPEITDHLSREASHAVYVPGTEFQIGRISMVANTGTYLDSPFHRYANAPTWPASSSIRWRNCLACWFVPPAARTGRSTATP